MADKQLQEKHRDEPFHSTGRGEGVDTEEDHNYQQQQRYGALKV